MVWTNSAVVKKPSATNHLHIHSLEQLAADEYARDRDLSAVLHADRDQVRLPQD